MKGANSTKGWLLYGKKYKVKKTTAPGSAPATTAFGKIFRKGGAKAASAKVPAAQSAAKELLRSR